MIITRLSGGLGNQMFQYAAGLALAHTRRTVLKLDVSWFGAAPGAKAHERYALSSFNLPEQFATEDEVERRRGVPLTRVERWSVALARRLHFYQYSRRLERRGRIHRDPGLRFDAAFFDQPDDTCLEGNWQSERFFAPVASQLKSHFTLRYPASPAVAELEARIRRGPSAFLHFRRGDYVTDPRYAREIGALAGDYYHAAVSRLRERAPDAVVYVFSDDIEGVARDFVPSGPHEFVREPPGTEPHQLLRLMTLCDHAIIANSTFSWWGAWLGERPGQLVIAPRRWFADGSPYNAADIVPERWLKL